MAGAEKNNSQLVEDKFGCRHCVEENGVDCDRPVPVEDGLRCLKTDKIIPYDYIDAEEEFGCQDCNFYKVGECGGPEDPPLLDDVEGYYCPAQEIGILKEALDSSDWHEVNEGLVLKGFLRRAIQRARVLKRRKAQYGNTTSTMYIPVDGSKEMPKNWPFEWGEDR